MSTEKYTPEGDPRDEGQAPAPAKVGPDRREEILQLLRSTIVPPTKDGVYAVRGFDHDGTSLAADPDIA